MRGQQLSKQSKVAVSQRESGNLVQAAIGEPGNTDTGKILDWADAVLLPGEFARVMEVLSKGKPKLIKVRVSTPIY